MILGVSGKGGEILKNNQPSHADLSDKHEKEGQVGIQTTRFENHWEANSLSLTECGTESAMRVHLCTRVCSHGTTARVEREASPWSPTLWASRLVNSESP